MKKFLSLCLAALLPLSVLTACGSSAPASSSDVPAEESTESNSGVGTYSFTELAMDGALEIPFTVELKSDGSFAITESNPIKGETVYTGASYQWKDSYFTTGALDGESRPEATWFDADGSCVWLVGEEGTVTPMNYVQPSFERSTSYQNIPYAGDSSSQVLDVYLPEEEGVYPVIVVVHGGGFKFGDQSMNIIAPIFAATEQGYAVVSVDYRKSSEAVFPAALGDVKAAVRWVRANADKYGFDCDNIAIWGESAGAYLSIMTALTPDVDELHAGVDANAEFSSAVKALVSFYAPVDFWHLDADAEVVGLDSDFGSASSFESDFLGQALSQDESFTNRTWWGSYVDQLPADFALKAWVQVGDSDHRVPYTQSVHLAEQLTELLGEDNVEFSIIEGADHEDDAFYTQENLSAVLSFLDGILK